MALAAPQPVANWIRWHQQMPQHYYHSSPPTQTYGSSSYNTDFMTRVPAPMQYTPSFHSGNFYGSSMAYCEPSTPHTSYLSPAQTVASPVSFTSCSSRVDDLSEGEKLDSFSKQRQQAALQPRKSLLQTSATHSKASMIPTEILNSKTITINQNPNESIEFDTNVDQLMRAIQVDNVNVKEESQQLLTPSPSPKQEPSTPPGLLPCASDLDNKGLVKPKKYICTGPNCNKTFSQKTHLTIHLRTHTGIRPYICEFENCGRTFSQLGNLKTHVRRHSGEKPFKCSQCDKTFVQKSNVRSHERTHSDTKPFTCILDGCSKKFTQLGNMKAHQNNYHQEALRDLTNKFVKFSEEGHVPTEYLSLFEYFKVHYKNSNKGIKGRGKARKVVGRETKPKAISASGRRQMSKTVSAVPQQASSQMASMDPRYTSVHGLMPVFAYNHAPQMLMPHSFF